MGGVFTVSKGVNISSSGGGELKRRGAKLEDSPLTSKQCRLSRDQLCGVRNNSLHFGLRRGAALGG